MNSAAQIRTERKYSEALIEKIVASADDANKTKNWDMGHYIIDTTGQHQVYFTLYRYKVSKSSYVSPYTYIKNITSDFAKLEEALGYLNAQPIPVLIVSEHNNDAKVCSFRNRSREGVPTLSFGKYKGKTIAEIWEQDRGYVLWFANNFNITTDKGYKLVSAAKELATIFFKERTEENRLNCTSNYIGKLGDKLTTDAKVISISENKQLEYTTIQLVLENGDLIYIYDKDFGLEVSNVVTIKGTITKHIEKMGKKLTYINRVKVTTK